MNNQEVYDKVKEHLLNQKTQSHNIDGQCMYRAHNGNKCAIGILLPDDVYQKSMEHRSVDELLRIYRPVRELFIGIDEKLLFELQVIHDKYLPNLWENELRTTALRFHLKP